MNDDIFRTAARFIRPLLLLFSLFLLLLGHNEPGGGFVGGLMAASAFILQAMAEGTEAARRSLHVDPFALMAAGLGTAITAGAVATVMGRPFLTGTWMEIHIPPYGTLHLGTPLLFDLGVYFVVAGTALAIVLGFAEK